VVDVTKGMAAAIDPKSLMYLYGMKLDYSDALIGGGFSFDNPNADSSCGCGKSFGAAGVPPPPASVSCNDA